MNDLFWPNGIIGQTYNESKNNTDNTLNKMMQLNNFDSQQEFLQKKCRELKDSYINVQDQQD